MNEFVQFAILALASGRITLLFTNDDITERFRIAVFMASPPENDERKGYWFQNYRKTGFLKYEYAQSPVRSAGFWGRALSCPDCSGVWISGLLVASYVLLGPTIVYVVAPFAMAMIVSLLARRY